MRRGGTVLYRSRLHATLKRNCQVMPGADWLALLCKHIPDRHEPDPEIPNPARQAAKAAWAKLIRKVYEVDPLLCPKCGAQMRVIALIEAASVVTSVGAPR